MTDDKVIHIYDWRRPLKNGEPLCAMPIDNRVINPEAYQKGDQRVLTILARCKRLQFLIVAGVVTLIAIGAVRWF